MKNAAMVLALAIGVAGLAHADELEDRALAHDAFANQYNFSPLGGIGYVHFDSPETFTPVRYSLSDSTIWTGAYLAAEALRYAVTGDSEAKANAIRTVEGLDTHLKITQTTGFIARGAAPDTAPWNAGYIGHDRYVAGTGDWAGYFWINNTSRDQYTGWFFGMALAYDLIDDEPTRQIIRDDIEEVLLTLADQNWVILGEDGKRTDAAPKVQPPHRLAWLAAAVRIVGTDEMRTLYLDEYEANKDAYKLYNFSWFNKYQQYYGFNLNHMNHFTLWRNETSPERRAHYLAAYHDMVFDLVKHTHNVFFDAIYLANCERAGECRDYDETLADMQVQIAEFQDPPVRDISFDIPDWPLDPVSVFLSDLIDQLGIRDLIDIEYQTADPRPVMYRCPASFMWQKTPYNLDCAGGPGTEVYPGVDYMLAYWMGRYFDLIDPGNANEPFWPADETDDDDDDDATDDDDAADDDTSDDDASDDDAGTDDDDAAATDDDDTAPVDSGDDDDDGGCGC
ncbi:hypothetical protein K8I61_19155 [bacterium]|nr:hypothetical protein [bacterium]